MESSFLLSLCIYSICLVGLNAQSCPSSGNITNGVQSKLIRADNGSLLGIRVSWSWSSIVTIQPLCFQAAELVLYISSSNGRPFRTVCEGINITRHNNSVNFFDLDCNVMYTPEVRVTNVLSIRLKQSGSPLLFGGGSLGSPPLVLSRVCVGPPVLSAAGGNLNVSWDLLPCHLQNGADITGYIIQYTQLSTSNSTRTNITNEDKQVACDTDEFGNRYNCLLAPSLFQQYHTYSFQVAAHNSLGFGPFSHPVNRNVSTTSQVANCTSVLERNNTTTGSSVIPEVSTGVILVTTSTHDQSHISIEPTSHDVSTHTTPLIVSTRTTTLIASTDPTSLIAGVIVATLTVLFGVLLSILILVFIKKRKQKKKLDPTYDVVHESKDKMSLPKIEAVAEHSKAVEKTIDDIHHHSENEQTTTNLTLLENVLYEPASKPKITDFQPEVHASEGEQVTLRVNYTGIPKPTLTWKFKGTKMEGDYATELGTDGSLLFVCVEKKYAGRYCFEVSNRLGSIEGSVALVVEEEEEGDGEGSLGQRFESNPVTQQGFGEYVASLHSYNNSTFILQYQSLLSGEEGQAVAFGRSEVNRPLNRFKNITAYDDHRISLVPLSHAAECQGSYINASYINGYSRENAYIASQGPLPKTVTDFWRLVWQEKVRTIAMVTNIKEGKTKKCEQYWPEAGSGMRCGPFKLSLVEQHIFADYTIRTIQLDLSLAGESGSSRKVMQYHFTAWPDHGVPEYAGPILNYLRRINTQHKQNRGPILVHCSAGVGRTGTLIAIDIALSQASKEKLVDIPKIIVDMRRQRMKMVQTVDQYAFIHDAVLETLTCGDTQIPASDLKKALDKLKRADQNSEGMTGFRKQFKVLEQVSPNPSDVFCDAAKMYPTRNRNNNFLPSDGWRVALRGESTDYIHASFANGYKQNKGFIIAQSPMPSTVEDFVKMLYERECGVVVMLCGCEEGGVEMCTQYWPNTVSTMMKYGEFVVSTASISDSCDGFIQRSITITDSMSGQVQKLTQFQVDQWSPEGLCSNPQALLHVIDQMGVVQRRTGNKPIVVHGSDTVSRVGVFCSLVNAIEMCKTEGVVDVFQVVKALRIQKPGAVLSVNQYQFIFDLILLFLDSFSIYSNFK